jgi:uncharacterized membrane protein
VVAFLFLVCLVLVVLVLDARSRIARQDRLIQDVLNRITAIEFDRREQPAAQRKAPDRRVALVQPTPQVISPPVVEAPAPPPVPPEPVLATPAPPVRSGPARVILDETPAPPAPPKPAPESSDEQEPVRARAFALPKLNIPKISISFETFFGAKLPIWIGGIALILAGFFLVRYSIEKGLLGPGVRSVMAAVFGITLLFASEAARRIPRFAEDPRVGQALAGAGIASLYGTLYMASELYLLITPLAAFVAMVAVTIAALVLSLRHGPPTAIMGLIGGFTAPFMAAPSGNLVPLFIYLGLLIAGLFAVAIHRGWRWLAVAATGGGLTWSLGIMLTNQAGIGPSLGMFVVAVAIGSTMLFPKSGINQARICVLPMVAGFVQLAIFAPVIHFGLSGWALYGLLSAASLYLSWRDPKLTPASLAALGLVVILLYAAFDQGRDLAVWAAIGATILFAIPGHLLARRPDTDTHWTILALGGTAGPLLTAYLGGHSLLAEIQWGHLFGLAALPVAALSWRARGEGRATGLPDWALFGGGTAAAALVAIAALNWFEPLWLGGAVLAVALGLAYWARHTKDRALFAASLGFAGLGLILWLASFALHPTLFEAIVLNGGIPAIDQMIALLALPTALIAALSWCHRDRLADHPLRWIALGFALAIPLALVPALWHPVASLGFATALGLWARKSEDPFRFRASVTAVGAGLLFWASQLVSHLDLLNAVFADGVAPALMPLLALLILPAALIGLLSWCHRGQQSDHPLRWWALGMAVAIPLALVPALWHSVVMVASAAILAGWARRSGDAFRYSASLAALVVAAAFWLVEIARHLDIGMAVFGDGSVPPAEPLLALLAIPAALLGATAWGHQDRFADQPLRWQTLGLVLALLTALVPYDWHPVILMAAAALAALAGSRLPLPKFGLEGMFAVAGAVLAVRLLPFFVIMIMSVLGQRTHFALLPDITALLISITLPALIAGGARWQFRERMSGLFGQLVQGVVGIALVATLYALAKQPLAIATEDAFVASGFIERAAITQALFLIGMATLWRGGETLRLAAFTVLGLAAARLIGFDLIQLNPLLVRQNVGALPVLNVATLHFGLATLWCWLVAGKLGEGRLSKTLRFATLPMAAFAVGITVRQAFQGPVLDSFSLTRGENFAYSAAFLLLSLLWLWRGIAGASGWLRVAGLAVLTVVTLKVFLIDAAALQGLLRVLSFLGLGISLVGIGWAYGRLLGKGAADAASTD